MNQRITCFLLMFHTVAAPSTFAAPIKVGIIGLDAHAVPWTQIIHGPKAPPPISDLRIVAAFPAKTNEDGHVSGCVYTAPAVGAAIRYGPKETRDGSRYTEVLIVRHPSGRGAVRGRTPGAGADGGGSAEAFALPATSEASLETRQS